MPQKYAGCYRALVHFVSLIQDTSGSWGLCRAALLQQWSSTVHLQQNKQLQQFLSHYGSGLKPGGERLSDKLCFVVTDDWITGAAA